MVFLAASSFGASDCERIVGGALAQPVLALTSLAYAAVGLGVLSWALRSRAPLAGAAGVGLVAVGAGSFAFHGPQPSWAGVAHDAPVGAVTAVFVAGLVRSCRHRRWAEWRWPAGLFAVALAAYALGGSGSSMCHPDSLWQFHGAWHVLSAAAAGLAARRALNGWAPVPVPVPAGAPVPSPGASPRPEPLAGTAAPPGPRRSRHRSSRIRNDPCRAAVRDDSGGPSTGPADAWRTQRAL